MWVLSDDMSRELDNEYLSILKIKKYINKSTENKIYLMESH